MRLISPRQHGRRDERRHFAAEMGHVSVVRRLCALGADVEAEKFQDGTALHTAADTNNAAVARVLLEA